MADILIRGMEMPRNCFLCYFHKTTEHYVGDDEIMEKHYCTRTGQFAYDLDYENQLPGCPLIALPEGHGRLIDGDELASGCDAPYWCRWLSEIEDAPTIVPAEVEVESDG